MKGFPSKPGSDGGDSRQKDPNRPRNVCVSIMYESPQRAGRFCVTITNYLNYGHGRTGVSSIDERDTLTLAIEPQNIEQQHYEQNRNMSFQKQEVIGRTHGEWTHPSQLETGVPAHLGLKQLRVPVDQIFCLFQILGDELRCCSSVLVSLKLSIFFELKASQAVVLLLRKQFLFVRDVTQRRTGLYY